MLILELLILLFLFLGNAFFAYLGWSTIQGGNSVLNAVHPIFYLLAFYAILKYDQFFRSKFHWKNTVVILLIIILFFILFNRYILTRLAGNLLIPLLFSFYIQELSKKSKSVMICAKWFIFLFTVEVGLAIFERANHTLMFPYTLYNPEDINGMIDRDYFRSNSLLGHPLSNALCVSVVLAFIAVSNIKIYTKYFLLLIGFAALLCFNARFAIVMSSGFYVLYYLIKSKLNFGSVLTIAAAALLIFYLIFNLNLGDRLFSSGLSSDDSVLARVDVFDMLDFLEFDHIYKGSGIDFVEQSLGMLHIENWMLILLFDVGLLITIYYIWLLVKISLLRLSKYSLLDKMYMLGVFFIIASSNNSLATEVPAVSFLIASSLFIPYKHLANRRGKDKRTISTSSKNIIVPT